MMSKVSGEKDCKKGKEKLFAVQVEKFETTSNEESCKEVQDLTKKNNSTDKSPIIESKSQEKIRNVMCESSIKEVLGDDSNLPCTERMSSTGNVMEDRNEILPITRAKVYERKGTLVKVKPSSKSVFAKNSVIGI